MRPLALVALLSACTSAIFSPDYDRYDYYALHIHPSVSPPDVAHHLGLQLDAKLGELDDHYLLRKEKHPQDIVADAVREHRRRRKRSLTYSNSLLDGVLLHEKQKLRPPHEKRGPIYPYMPTPPRNLPRLNLDDDKPKTEEQKAAFQKQKEIASSLNISDPKFSMQWHLWNYMQPGFDLNVTGVWLNGITGKGATVCIVDDGLDFKSQDIKDNYFAEGSYDFNDKSPEPLPQLAEDRHGTRCAGEVSAVKNDVCGVGVAWDSKVSGIRILSKPISDADEALALVYEYQKNHIYSCSWGPPDDGTHMGAPGILIKRAMLSAIQKGRGGLGTIYVFAAGNGAASEDNCNFDGYTNSIYSITVGAIDWMGSHPYYSEKCSAQLIVTYSSGSGEAIHTTEVGNHACYGSHGGTSAAGPLAVGVFALALEVRPELTWRDLQWLTVLTAVEVPFPQKDHEDYQETSVGKRFSHQFGFGKLDAWAFVEAAKSFKLVKPQAWYFSPWQQVRHPIPQGKKGLSSELEITKEQLEEANLERVEHVTVKMNVNHTRRGDLSVELHSPTGVVSHIATSRRRDKKEAGYINWTFMSVAHWGETGVGKWVIIVKDTIENDFNGTFTDWKLSLFGESIDGDKQGLLPLPTQEDEADDGGAREEAVIATTTVKTSSQSELPSETPTDHHDRPVVTTTSSTEATEALVTPPPDQPDAPEHNNNNHGNNNNNNHNGNNNNNHHGNKHGNKHDNDVEPAPSPQQRPDNFLPSPFPNFGVSKRTQIWIYGAAGLITIFCIGLAVYFWTARKKAQRAQARDQYEFEVIDDEDDDRDDQANGKINGRKGKRRAGELYDAFAGESDEEMFSDEEGPEGRYHDHPPQHTIGDDDSEEDSEFGRNGKSKE